MAKMTKKGQGFVSNEISHLMKDGPGKGPQKNKKMPQRQAVAVALDVARRKGYKSASKEEAMSIFDGIVTHESQGSLFDGIVEGKASGSFFDGIVESTTEGLFDGIVEGETSGGLFDGIVEQEDTVKWDDRIARTMTLAEQLVDIRASVKKGK